MIIKKLSLFVPVILFSPLLTLAQSTCNCERSFKWVRETFEKNDAGFEYGMQQKGVAAYEEHTRNILAKVKKTTDKEQCAAIMREWLRFFRKGHHGIIPVYNSPAAPVAGSSAAPEVLSLSEEQVKQRIANAPVASFEGIWTTATYKIGIVKDGGGYKGVILASGNQAWKPGDVKLSIAADSAGVFYMGDFSPNKFEKAILLGKNTLQLANVFLKRQYPVFQEGDATLLYAREMTASAPFMQQVSDKTVLFRIPTFERYAKGAIDSLLKANDALLKRTENLVIDIRGNGGGSDVSYYGILPLIYTNPVRSVHTTFLSTPLNNSRMEGFLSIPGLPESDKAEVEAALKALREHPNQFVNLNNGKIVDELKLDTIFPFPKNVAIIINDQNGSTSEEFLLAARQSKKVKLFGTTTQGVLDISNTYTVESPDKQFKLVYALSKSLRIPDFAIDGKGIMPDYYMDKSIPDAEWLNHVTRILEQ
ncbi:S41 family peptidase [Chitinophaga sp. CB10]|uniref:S41 family peptidase n=1 Tax=Chitinophaga sp. CB10 TaxID=1891659 RepID=UPI000A3EEADA|nr:S41 family peptidase [Chitinophaga sp. CB10]